MPHYLYPAFFWAALAVLVPLLLHLFRRRHRKPQPLPSLFFLTAATQKTKANRWRRRLILISRCAAIVFLAAAFARPYFNEVKSSGSATVIVVDQSFSLQAAGRWNELHKWADQLIGNPETGDSLGLVSMALHPRWIEPLSTDTHAVREIFKELKPGWETAKVEPALRLAAEILDVSTARERRIIVMSDHQQVAWAGTDFSRKVPAGIKLIFAEPARPVKSQVALSAPVVEPVDAADGKWQGTVKLISYSDVVQDRTLKIFRENEAAPLTEIVLHLAPHQGRLQSLPVTLSEKTRWLRFTIEPDELAVDDTAFALVPALDAKSAVILIDGSPTPTAVDYPSTGLTSITNLTPSFRLAPIPLHSEWPRHARVLLRNAISFSGETSQRLDAFLEKGGEALVFIDKDMATSSWWLRHGINFSPLSQRAETWRIHDWTIEHPLVSPFSEYGLRNLLGWEFHSGWALPRGRTSPIGLWSDGSIAVGEVSIGAGRLLLCGFPANRQAGDWVIDEAFVPFIHRAMSQITSASLPGHATPHWVCERLSLPPGKGGWNALAGPARSQAPIIVDGQVTPTMPGIYRFESGAESTLWSIELSPEESDLTPWSNGLPWWQLQTVNAKTASTLALPVIDLSTQDSEEKDGRWWWCLAILSTLFLAELLLANRTTR